jgi:hypothetical protein
MVLKSHLIGYPQYNTNRDTAEYVALLISVLDAETVTILVEQAFTYCYGPI